MFASTNAWVDGQIVLETLEAQMYQAPAHVTYTQPTNEIILEKITFKIGAISRTNAHPMPKESSQRSCRGTIDHKYRSSNQPNAHLTPKHLTTFFP